MIKYSFYEFVKTLRTMEQLLEDAQAKDWYLEDFFEELNNLNIPLESVMTGDIAQVTQPIGMMKRKMVYEKAPDGPDAENWILKNKSAFKKHYGDDWEQVLYATSWKLFG